MFELGPRRWALVLGDVCGKGAEAAALDRHGPLDAAQPGHAGHRHAGCPAATERRLMRQDLNGRFITVAYLVLTVHDDRAHVTVACAGHPFPVLLPTHGDPRRARRPRDASGYLARHLAAHGRGGARSRRRPGGRTATASPSRGPALAPAVGGRGPRRRRRHQRRPGRVPAGAPRTPPGRSAARRHHGHGASVHR